MPSSMSFFNLFSARVIVTGILSLLLCNQACRKLVEYDITKESESSIADSLFVKAESLWGTDLSLACLYLDRARDFSGENSSFLARYHMIRGRIAYYEDEYALSLAHLDSALVFLEGDRNPELEADCHFYLASSLRLTGNYPTALAHNMQAVDLYQSAENISCLSRSYNFQGAMYLDQENYTQARSYVGKALVLSEQVPTSLVHANSLSTMGRILKASGDKQGADSCAREAYEIRLHNTNIRHIASSLIQLAELDMEQARFSQGHLHLTEAEEIYVELDEKVGLFNVLYIQARIYSAQGKMKLSRARALEAYGIGQQMDNPSVRSSIALLLSETEKAAGFPGLALGYYEEYVRYQKELVSLEKQQQITGMEYAHALENQQRDNEILLQRDQVRRQQGILQLLAIGVLLICVAALIVVLRFRILNNRTRQALLEKEKLLLENDLRVRNKELTGKTMELLHQNEILQSLAGRIEKLQGVDSRREIESILQELKVKNRKHAWDEFHTAFNHVHRDFYDRLFAQCPELSATELKIAALLKLNLSTKEIAAISYKSESAVKTARHRLRSKLKLDQSEQLVPYLMKL